jgi:hypothetical protein
VDVCHKKFELWWNFFLELWWSVKSSKKFLVIGKIWSGFHPGWWILRQRLCFSIKLSKFFVFHFQWSSI